MTKTDLSQIKELLRENNQVLRQDLMLEFGQFVEDNINPQFGELRDQIAALPSKTYIDDKFADQLSNFQTGLWRHNQSLVDILRDKQIIGFRISII